MVFFGKNQSTLAKVNKVLFVIVLVEILASFVFDWMQNYSLVSIGVLGVLGVMEGLATKTPIYFRGVEIVYGKNKGIYIFTCFMFGALALMALYKGLSKF
jgi:hypothetical protein